MNNLYVIDNKARRSSIFGIGTYLKELELSLQTSDLQICFIHINSDTQRFLQKTENDVYHWYIPTPQAIYKDEEKHNRLYFQNVVFLLKQHIKQTDNLIFHLNYLECKHLVDDLKTAFNCRIVLTIHFFVSSFDILGSVSRLQSIIDKPEKELDQFCKQVKKSFDNEKIMLCSVDKVISLSKYTTRLLHSIYNVKKNNICTIYNGLGDNANKKINKTLIRKKYNLPINASIIIFTGRLDPAKGLSYLIRASKIVLDRHSNCHIIIAGSGDYESCLKECGKMWMNIHFTGFLEKTELYELYSIADFGVLPSFHEQCSYVAIEMMMHGLPIIATDTTGLSEMINNGVTGLYVPLKESENMTLIDVSILTEKMLYLLENELTRKQMRVNARKRYMRFYSLKKMSKKMINLYNELTG